MHLQNFQHILCENLFVLYIRSIIEMLFNLVCKEANLPLATLILLNRKSHPLENDNYPGQCQMY